MQILEVIKRDYLIKDITSKKPEFLKATMNIFEEAIFPECLSVFYCKKKESENCVCIKIVLWKIESFEASFMQKLVDFMSHSAKVFSDFNYCSSISYLNVEEELVVVDIYELKDEFFGECLDVEM